ncbi:MAG: hypothetical protein ACLTWK_12175 [Eisenbergiella sp.]
MSIISGYKKFKKHIKTNEGFQLQSLWTNANTVEADDKRTMQTKVGAINGISSSETANSGEIAASTALTNKMNGSINQLSRDLGGFSFHSNENGHYLQKGDEMYLLKNKPLEISTWYYQANGGKTEFILDSSEYKKLSIGQVDGNGGSMSVLGMASSAITLSKESDGYYDVTAYDQVVIRISASTYVKGTVSNIRLW